ncbi:hypothetical protein GRS96_01725 [Rathayibacter sp. VKM Ac-2803]|uniref:hypothetical protein n=1 Tax=unclassified Rathayibacter TaxID=2609250 RepID=UPI00135812C7|nr:MULTISPECIES: hypothetical protein [unclassified Rathayibacter]MWV47991.1 hypothetical protein [Rathayibacter sp. VKM Ac-2803]MWV58784.1 hypothetical protein [Rathayibacter sp. VKM Ac-2754]
MFSLFLAAAGQVALVAVILGAGLPALFAVGVRSFAVAGDSALAERSLPAPLLRVIGVVCFVLVIAAVAIGLSIIIATGLGQTVSFENVFPTFQPKD